MQLAHSDVKHLVIGEEKSNASLLIHEEKMSIECGYKLSGISLKPHRMILSWSLTPVVSRYTTLWLHERKVFQLSVHTLVHVREADAI